MPSGKNNPPRNVDDMIANATPSVDIQATIDTLEGNETSIASLDAQFGAKRTEQTSVMGSNAPTNYTGVRDEIYRKWGKEADELTEADLQNSTSRRPRPVPRPMFPSSKPSRTSDPTK